MRGWRNSKKKGRGDCFLLIHLTHFLTQYNNSDILRKNSQKLFGVRVSKENFRHRGIVEPKQWFGYPRSYFAAWIGAASRIVWKRIKQSSTFFYTHRSHEAAEKCWHLHRMVPAASKQMEELKVGLGNSLVLRPDDQRLYWPLMTRVRGKPWLEA